MTTSRSGRVVMLVENQVDGDSRVQKAAATVADAGWDTVLIGRAPGTEVTEHHIGSALVRRVPVTFRLSQWRTRAPGWRPWRPFAYASRDRSTIAARRIDTLKVSLRERGALGRLRPPTLGHRLGTAALRVRLRLALVVYRERNRELSRAIEAVRSGDTRTQRTYARLVHLVLGRSSWRRLDPLLWDYELHYGPVLDELEPDLVHAHDFRMIGVATRYAERRKALGVPCRVVYDAHEFLPGIRYRNLPWHIANEDHESQYIGRVDAVVTVSATLARMLQERHALPSEPTVVLNAPAIASDDSVDGVRASISLGPDVPLMIYVGSPSVQRGLATMIESLPLLPDWHAALVLPPASGLIPAMLESAAALGVADRLHVLPYVPHDEVVAFVRTADIGVIPLLHQPNHEISLATKYFEFAQARLPMVVSDVRTMAEVTRQLGNGLVFTAGDTDDFVARVTEAYARRTELAATYSDEVLHDWSWPAQEDVLVALYDHLLTTPGQTA